MVDVNTLSAQKKYGYFEGGHIMENFAFSPDSMFFIFKIWHAGDAVTCGVIDVRECKSRLLGNEPARIAWSTKSDKVCVMETRASDLSVIKVYARGHNKTLRLVREVRLGKKIPNDISWKSDSLLIVSPLFKLRLK